MSPPTTPRRSRSRSTSPNRTSSTVTPTSVTTTLTTSSTALISPSTLALIQRLRRSPVVSSPLRPPSNEPSPKRYDWITYAATRPDGSVIRQDRVPSPKRALYSQARASTLSRTQSQRPSLRPARPVRPPRPLSSPEFQVSNTETPSPTPPVDTPVLVASQALASAVQLQSPPTDFSSIIVDEDDDPVYPCGCSECLEKIAKELFQDTDGQVYDPIFNPHPDFIAKTRHDRDATNRKHDTVYFQIVPGLHKPVCCSDTLQLSVHQSIVQRLSRKNEERSRLQNYSEAFSSLLSPITTNSSDSPPSSSSSSQPLPLLTSTPLPLRPPLSSSSSSSSTQPISYRPRIRQSPRASTSSLPDADRMERFRTAQDMATGDATGIWGERNAQDEPPPSPRPAKRPYPKSPTHDQELPNPLGAEYGGIRIPTLPPMPDFGAIGDPIEAPPRPARPESPTLGDDSSSFIAGPSWTTPTFPTLRDLEDTPDSVADELLVTPENAVETLPRASGSGPVEEDEEVEDEDEAPPRRLDKGKGRAEPLGPDVYASRRERGKRAALGLGLELNPPPAKRDKGKRRADSRSPSRHGRHERSTSSHSPHERLLVFGRDNDDPDATFSDDIQAMHLDLVGKISTLEMEREDHAARGSDYIVLYVLDKRIADLYESLSELAGVACERNAGYQGLTDEEVAHQCQREYDREAKERDTSIRYESNEYEGSLVVLEDDYTPTRSTSSSDSDEVIEIHLSDDPPSPRLEAQFSVTVASLASHLTAPGRTSRSLRSRNLVDLPRVDSADVSDSIPDRALVYYAPPRGGPSPHILVTPPTPMVLDNSALDAAANIQVTERVRPAGSPLSNVSASERLWEMFGNMDEAVVGRRHSVADISIAPVRPSIDAPSRVRPQLARRRASDGGALPTVSGIWGGLEASMGLGIRVTESVVVEQSEILGGVETDVTMDLPRHAPFASRLAQYLQGPVRHEEDAGTDGDDESTIRGLANYNETDNVGHSQDDADWTSSWSESEGEVDMAPLLAPYQPIEMDTNDIHPTGTANRARRVFDDSVEEFEFYLQAYESTHGPVVLPSSNPTVEVVRIRNLERRRMMRVVTISVVVRTIMICAQVGVLAWVWFGILRFGEGLFM